MSSNQIILQLGIGDGDVQPIPFDNKTDLLDYVKELKSFDCVWIATVNGEFGQLLVTEKIEDIHYSIKCDGLPVQKGENIFIFEHESYEEAYKVALSMREGNPKCYNK